MNTYSVSPPFSSIAFIKERTDLLSRCIRFFTWSSTSHCEICNGYKNTVTTDVKQGVHSDTLFRYEDKDQRYTIWVANLYISTKVEIAMKRWLDNQLGKGYDKFGSASSISWLSWLREDKEQLFCSELCLLFIQKLEFL